MTTSERVLVYVIFMLFGMTIGSVLTSVMYSAFPPEGEYWADVRYSQCLKANTDPSVCFNEWQEAMLQLDREKREGR